MKNIFFSIFSKQQKDISKKYNFLNLIFHFFVPKLRQKWKKIVIPYKFNPHPLIKFSLERYNSLFFGFLRIVKKVTKMKFRQSKKNCPVNRSSGDWIIG